MNEILLFLLLGLGTGATIAAIAVGVVVTYRGSGFINLAAGAIAMLAGFSFWALRTGELGFTVGTPLGRRALLRVRDSSSASRSSSRSSGRSAPLRRWRSSSPRSASCSRRRRSMLLAFGTSQHPQPTIIPIRVIRMLDGGGAAVRLRAQRHRRRDHRPALGALSLDALRARDPRSVGERRRGPPRRPVAGRAVAREHAARQPAARHARDLRRLGGGARHDHAAVPRRARHSPPPSSPGSRRSAIACVCGLGIGMARVADRVRVDEVVVPDHPGRGLAGRQGAARLRAHRGGDVPARRVAADARRARRAAPPRRASPEARGHARDPVDASCARSRSSCCRSTSARR